MRIKFLTKKYAVFSHSEAFPPLSSAFPERCKKKKAAINRCFFVIAIPVTARGAPAAAKYFFFYRKRFIPSVAADGSSLSATVKLTLCCSENFSSLFRNSSALATSLIPAILYRLSMNTRVMS